MREILFRGKNKANKWVIGYLTLTSLGDFVIAYQNDWRPSYNNPDEGNRLEYEIVKMETICQYTGLRDMDKNKLWEHDVVYMHLSDRVERGIVEYAETLGCFVVKLLDEDGNKIPRSWFLIGMNIGIIERIGSRIDNPKLLKGE